MYKSSPEAPAKSASIVELGLLLILLDITAGAQAAKLLPVVCLGAASPVHNGQPRLGAIRVGTLRQRMLIDGLLNLHHRRQSQGRGLTVFTGTPAQVLPVLVWLLQLTEMHTEAI
ncbi:MAG: hypothetical protein PHH58_05990 [Rhodoferax sp.]|nr:hypothetical protein [Rhodoferax sp.]